MTGPGIVIDQRCSGGQHDVLCVLVPLDGSAQAEQALPIAARMARTAGGSVALVRVVRAPSEFELGLTPPATWAPAVRPEEREESAAYLEAVQHRETLAGLPSTKAVYAGSPAAMILAAAASTSVDLVVLTSRGRTGMAHWLLGSVAAEVARESAVLVLVVRGSALADALDAGQPRALSALVPLDGSPLAEAALIPALQLLGALAGDAPVALHLLSVVQPLPLTATAPLAGGVSGEGQIILTPVDTAMLGEAEEYLCATAEQLRRDAGQLLPGRLVSITWSATGARMSPMPSSPSRSRDAMGRAAPTRRARSPPATSSPWLPTGTAGCSAR